MITSPDRPAHRNQRRRPSPGRGRHAAGFRRPPRFGPPGSAHRWLFATSVVLAAVLTIPAAMSLSAHVNSNTSTAYASDLVVNGGFEEGTTGWRTNLTTQALRLVNPGYAGAQAVVATNSVAGNVIVNDTVNTVASTTANTTYDVSATVRSTGKHISGALVIRENGTGSVLRSQDQTAFYVSTGWKTVNLGFTTAASVDQLDLNVLAWHVPVGTGLVVDEVRMAPRLSTPTSQPPTTTVPATTTTTTTTTTTMTTTAVPTTTMPTTTVPTSTTTVPTTSVLPSTTTTTTTSPVPTSTTSTTSSATCISGQMGLPGAGTAYLGAAVGGTSSMDQREAALGTTLPIHRKYYSPDQVDYAVSVTKDDLARSRLPWISFKLPYSWADMAAGRGDAWAANLTDKLAALNGPVWLAFHHEPEGDGPIQDWTAMQQHLAPIVHARSNNIAYTVIYISWDAFGGGDPQYQIDNTWPGDQYVDVLGLDMYNGYGAVRNGVLGTTMLDPMKYMGPASQFARAHGVRWGVGEIGYTKEASDVDPNWLRLAYDDMVNNGGVGMSYFDSSLNSIADWTLDYAPKFDHYKSLMPEAARVC